jgi:hypothetical protein
LNRPPLLGAQDSAALRERLLAQLKDADDLLAWAKTSLPLKNTLQEADARSVEAAYQERLESAAHPAVDKVEEQAAPEVANASATEPAQGPRASTRPAEDEPAQEVKKGGLAIPKELSRKRSKAHLAFVRQHPCLVCKRSPSDAHHLKFAQPRTIGHKVSDEFTALMPLASSGPAPEWRRKSMVGEYANSAAACCKGTLDGEHGRDERQSPLIGSHPGPAARNGGSTAMNGPVRLALRARDVALIKTVQWADCSRLCGPVHTPLGTIHTKSGMQSRCYHQRPMTTAA